MLLIVCLILLMCSRYMGAGGAARQKLYGGVHSTPAQGTVCLRPSSSWAWRDGELSCMTGGQLPPPRSMGSWHNTHWDCYYNVLTWDQSGTGFAETKFLPFFAATWAACRCCKTNPLLLDMVHISIHCCKPPCPILQPLLSQGIHHDGDPRQAERQERHVAALLGSIPSMQ